MNTPKTPKRWKGNHSWPAKAGESLYYTVESESHLALIGKVIVHFGHLEQAMHLVLAELLGEGAHYAASIIFNSIQAPRARISILKALLEERPENVEMPSDMDEFIDEYTSINKARNDVVHGLWYTGDQDSLTFLAKTDNLGLAYMKAEVIDTKTLEAIVSRMEALESKIFSWKVKKAKDGN